MAKTIWSIFINVQKVLAHFNIPIFCPLPSEVTGKRMFKLICAAGTEGCWTRKRNKRRSYKILKTTYPSPGHVPDLQHRHNARFWKLRSA
jgi:hypothetical protein